MYLVELPRFTYPSNLRDRHARISGPQNFEDFNEDLPSWTKLDEARTRLLLTTPPKDIHVQSELNEITTLWELANTKHYYTNFEKQNLLARGGKKRKRKGTE